MFVLRAKVKLLDASPMYSLHGLLGHSAQDFLSKQVQTAHANDFLPKPLLAGICSSLSTNEPIHWLKIHSDESHPRIVLCIPQSAPVKELLSHPPHTNLSAWQLGEILSAVPLLQASGFEHYVPQMLNYESVNGVNFKKGCYPGQEVVARSQFRGTLKRRLLLIYAHTTLAPNQELYAAKATDGQPVGELVQTQHVDGVSLGLACIQLPVFDEESEWTTPDDWQNLTEPCLTSCLVTLDSNHQALPVGLLPLPYALLKDI
jgi:folate-binding protein YgfZ